MAEAEGLSHSKKIGISLCCAVLIIFIILGTLSYIGRQKEAFFFAWRLSKIS